MDRKRGREGSREVIEGEVTGSVDDSRVYLQALGYTPRLNKDIDLATSNARGLLISCRFRREISATREAVRILNSLLDQYPLTGRNLPDDKVVDAEPKPRWEPCKTGASGLLFLRLLDPTLDPITTAQRFYDAKPKVDFIQRVTPVEATVSAASPTNLQHDPIAKLLHQHFNGTNASVAISIHTRGGTAADRALYINTLMQLINPNADARVDARADNKPKALVDTDVDADDGASAVHHRVDLSDPDLVIVCELLPVGVFAVAVIAHRSRGLSSILHVNKSGIRVKSLQRGEATIRPPATKKKR